MSLIKLYQIIDKSFIGRFVENKLSIIENTDPERIYVENVRSFYNMPTVMAKALCGLAVKEGVFTKHYGLYCHNEDCGKMIMSVETEAQIPSKIHCDNCELLEKDDYDFVPDKRHTEVFYKLIK